MAYLEVKNLAKSYKEKQVLKDFSCSLEKGETLVIIGDSGSGKTTFLRCLNYLENKDHGTIILDGEILQDEHKQTKKEILSHRQNLSLVFQSYNLFPQYTVLENLLLAVKIRLKKELKKKKLSRKDYKIAYNKLWGEKLSQAEMLLSSVNLQDKKNSYPCQLSGGEAQRAAILRSLILEPKVLCFDEPTSALDPKLKREVANTILSLKAQKKTILVVTHEMELASLIADKVIFLEKGVIMEQGTSALLTSPKTDALKAFLSLEKKEGINENARKEELEKNRADGTLFSLSQD